jgi:pimeloyl-ACP methyl ester carboxylesterase
MNEPVQFLAVDADEKRGFPARRLAFARQAGKEPTILWMGGFRSDMSSTKAMKLEEAAALEGRASLRFDYSAHGESSGDFATATLSQWLDDALHMIRENGGNKPVIVGSSMGGWLALRATQILAGEGRAPGGLVLIAPAVDFTEALMWAQFPPAIKKQIEEDGVWYRPSEYSPEPYPITRALIEDGRKHLLMGKALHFGVPIHILQGAQDPDVPLAHVEKFVSGLARDDVRMSVIPDGNHRLSRDEDIAALQRITLALAAEVEAGR